MKRAGIFVLIIIITSCSKKTFYYPSDRGATTETKTLYYSLQRLIDGGIIFGHHDDTAYGVEWRFDNDSSDVKGVTGSYPGLYGWDLSKIEHDNTADINGVPFSLQRERVKEAYERGGINTFSWHMDNPADGKTAWDTTIHTVADIIPGGPFHSVYVQYLDRAAKYLGTLKGKDGEAIPILFRPFHEFTGNWFWWGRNTCTPDEFKTLWRFTVDYLRNTKNLHNLLIVYSSADFNSEAEFLARYPGDRYVDFVGFDAYCSNDIAGFEKKLDRQLTLLDTIAAKHHKLPCLAETGYLNIPMADWWTKVLLPIISKHNISYLLTWRNADFRQYYVPYPGQDSADDFRKFFDDPRLIFQNRLTPLAVYGKLLE